MRNWSALLRHAKQNNKKCDWFHWVTRWEYTNTRKIISLMFQNTWKFKSKNLHFYLFLKPCHVTVCKQWMEPYYPFKCQRLFLVVFFSSEILKIWHCNAISQEWMNRITKFCIPFCRKFPALTWKFQQSFIIFTVSVKVTAVLKRPWCHIEYTSLLGWWFSTYETRWKEFEFTGTV